MRKIFPGYYRPTEAEFERLWQEATFVFDANVLLGLYRYTAAARDDLLRVLRHLETRIWLPHQAALEYQRNRVAVISAQAKTFSQIRQSLVDARDALTRHAFLSAKQTNEIKALARKIETHLDAAEKEQVVSASNDPLRASLDQLFEGRVGSAYDPPEQEKHEKNAQCRIDARTPPGCRDAGKDDQHRRLGDVLLWLQILDFAKEKTPVILVTDDRKDDWWLRHDGQTLGPRPELVEEFRDVTGQEFYMYDTQCFVDRAKKTFGIVKEATVKEVRDRTRVSLEDHIASQFAARYGLQFGLPDFAKFRAHVDLADQFAKRIEAAQKLGALLDFGDGVTKRLLEARKLGLAEPDLGVRPTEPLKPADSETEK